MDRFVLSVLVNNHSGVLSRVAGLFSRRGYNIDSLSVGVTENPEISRITIVVCGDKFVLEQITKQLEKLVDVLAIRELKPEKSVVRELVFIKIRVDQGSRMQAIEIANIFKAKIIDVVCDSMTMQMTGDPAKITAFIKMLDQFGVVELVRTGLTAIGRGSKSVSDMLRD